MIVAPYAYYDIKHEDIVVCISEHTPREGRATPESELTPCVFMIGRNILTNPEHKDWVINALKAGGVTYRLIDKSPMSETHEAGQVPTPRSEPA
jgi:hypothetical protein